jgi:hypothetical protein
MNESITTNYMTNKQTSAAAAAAAAAAVAILTNNNTTPYIGRRQQRANEHTYTLLTCQTQPARSSTH